MNSSLKKASAIITILLVAISANPFESNTLHCLSTMHSVLVLFGLQTFDISKNKTGDEP